MHTEFDQAWQAMSNEILTGMKEWRLQHPRATLNEIEAALDERLTRLRARMLEDVALASAATEWEEGGKCPECGRKARARGGSPRRRLLTRGGHEIELKRQRGECPACGAGFFPLG
jgi:hypothetical protein